MREKDVLFQLTSQRQSKHSEATWKTSFNGDSVVLVYKEGLDSFFCLGSGVIGLTVNFGTTNPGCFDLRLPEDEPVPIPLGVSATNNRGSISSGDSMAGYSPGYVWREKEREKSSWERIGEREIIERKESRENETENMKEKLKKERERKYWVGWGRNTIDNYFLKHNDSMISITDKYTWFWQFSAYEEEKKRDRGENVREWERERECNIYEWGSKTVEVISKEEWKGCFWLEEKKLSLLPIVCNNRQNNQLLKYLSLLDKIDERRKRERNERMKWWKEEERTFEKYLSWIPVTGNKSCIKGKKKKSILLNQSMDKRSHNIVNGFFHDLSMEKNRWLIDELK